jgi:hypothetical protein
MRSLIAAAIGSTVTAAIMLTLTPEPQVRHHTEVRDRIVVDQVITTIDLDRIRDTSAATDLEPQLLAECAYAIQRHTEEPLAGIIYYADRYWQADTCAAYEHLMVHGWY